MWFVFSSFLDITRVCVSLKRGSVGAMMATVIVSSVDEEDSSSGQSGQGVGHLADSGVVDESLEEQQEA